MPRKDKNQASTSRRQFIKNSSALVAGGALTGSLGSLQAAHTSVNDEIKVALIGCGGRGAGAANQALRTPGRTRLVAMADAFADNLDIRYKALKASHPDKVDVPEEKRFVGFDAYKQVLDSDVDLVILATPPGFRPIHFEAAVKAGKHVFMEKPVAVDVPGVRQVLEAGKLADQKGVKVGVGLQRHHHAGYVETIKRLQDGAIGDILFTRVYWNGAGVWTRPRRKGQTEMEYQMRNWYYFNWLCGDHINEQHIHNLDVTNWLKNSYPVKAQGQGGRQVRTSKEHGEIFDHHMVEYTYDDGTVMLSQCRHMPNCYNTVNEYAHGTKGTSHITKGSIEGKQKWRFRRGTENPYQVEHNNLFAAVRSGTPYNESEYGAKSTMTSILGRLATYSGKVITWDEAINSTISLAPEKYDFDATPPVVPDADGFYPVAVPGVTKVL